MLNVYDLLYEMMCLYEKVNLCDLMFDEMMITKDISRKGFLKTSLSLLTYILKFYLLGISRLVSK